MSVAVIRTQLMEALNSMQTLKAAFDWEASNPDGKYPFATLTIREGEGVFRSTAHNLRNRGFNIKVYQEQSKIGQGAENAEDIVVNIIDELERYFDMNTTLSGTCKYTRPIGYDAGYVDREHDTRILEYKVDVYELVSAS